MADSKASALGVATALAGSELWAGVQDGADVKITPALVEAYIRAAIVASVLGGDDNFASTMEAALAAKQAHSSKLDAIAGANPIADGAHTVGGITITTVGGIIVAIS